MPTRQPPSPAGRRIYIKGAATWSRHPIHGWRATAPPRKPAQGQTYRQRVAQQVFALASRLGAMPSAEDRAHADDVTRGGPWTWKDYYVSTLYGQGLEVYLANGTTWLPRRDFLMTIQQLLDSISNQPGSILVRTNFSWAVLFPGSGGQVLMMNQASGLPYWADQSALIDAGGAARQWTIWQQMVAPLTDIIIPSPRSWLLRMYLLRGTVVNGAELWINSLTAAGQWQSGLIAPHATSPTLTGALLASSAIATNINAGKNQLPFTSPWTAPSDGWYYLAITETGVTARGPTSSINTYTAQGTHIPLPSDTSTISWSALGTQFAFWPY